MKNLLYTLMICLTACGVSQSEYEALKTQNEALKHAITKLEKRLDERDFLKSHAQVVLPNTELRAIHSVANGQDYQIKIQLPRGYQKSTRSYPVLYVTDAETNFGGISYIVQRLIKDELIPPLIVVGIAYGTDYRTFYALRSRDLTPVEDATLKIGGKVDPTGGAPEFCDFLLGELFPMIESNYRVDANQRTLYGHSYGGLFASYVLLNRHQLFNNYLILSPSLWYKDKFMFDEVSGFTKALTPTNVYMGSGSLEHRIAGYQAEFVAKLEAKNIEGLKIKAETHKNETHRTVFGIGFTNGMRYLFNIQ